MAKVCVRSSASRTCLLFRAFQTALRVAIGFKTIVLDGDWEGKPIHREAKAFYCEYTKHWHDVEDYLSKSFGGRYYIDEFVKEVK